VIAIGSEGSGKTSALFTTTTRLIAAKKLNRFAALSPALSPTSPKTDFTWCGRISKELCEFNRIPALTDDGVRNYEVMEEAFAVSIGKKSCVFSSEISANAAKPRRCGARAVARVPWGRRVGRAEQRGEKQQWNY
jgi:hypothetical protein